MKKKSLILEVRDKLLQKCCLTKRCFWGEGMSSFFSLFSKCGVLVLFSNLRIQCAAPFMWRSGKIRPQRKAVGALSFHRRTVQTTFFFKMESEYSPSFILIKLFKRS